MSELRGCSGLSHAFVYRGKLPLGSKCECGAYESGPTGPTGMTAQPVSHAVPIPLPPEPPRDRVVEAVDQDGTVVERWRWNGEWWCYDVEEGFGAISWDEIVRRAARWKAMGMGWTLRHVAAESGEQ